MLCKIPFYSLVNQKLRKVPATSVPVNMLRPLLFVVGMMLFVMVGNSLQARAGVTIDLGEQVRVEFETGNFDVKSYSGDMQGVNLYIENHLAMTAGRVILESDGAPNSENRRVRKLNAFDVLLVEEGVSAAEFKLVNFDLGAFQELGQVSSFDDGLSDGSSAALSGIRYQAESSLLEIDVIETLPFKFKSLPNGTRFAEAGGLRVSGMAITPTAVSADAQPYVDVLAAEGISKLVTDIVISQDTELILGELVSNQTIQVALRGLGALSFAGDFKMQLDTFDQIIAYSVGEPEAAEDALGLLGDIELIKLGLDYSDTGLIDVALKMAAINGNTTTEAARSEFRQLVGGSVDDMFPRNGEILSGPVDDLLASGGGLRIRVEPGSPIPLSNMLGFMILPDLAFDQLNVKVVHLMAP